MIYFYKKNYLIFSYSYNELENTKLFQLLILEYLNQFSKELLELRETEYNKNMKSFWTKKLLKIKKHNIYLKIFKNILTY